MTSPILFKKDWENFPTAIVDYNTTNESFKRLVALYKRMGIDNAEFILALYQPDLVGVDPFDPTLSKELKFKIALEAKYNPWFFFSGNRENTAQRGHSACSLSRQPRQYRPVLVVL